MGWDINENEAVCSETTYDMDTGHKLTERRPRQVHLGASEVTSFSYTAVDFPVDAIWSFPEASFEIVPVTITNELQHKIHTHTDLATGANIASYGPNDNEGGYMVIDGYGRVLETWISTDVAGPGDPYLWERTSINEYQDLASPQVKIERSSRNPNPEAFYQTSFNDTYWGERRTTFDGAGRALDIHEWDISDDEEFSTRSFQYDSEGNLDLVTAPDPSTDNNAIRVTYNFSYDSLGRRTCALTPNSTGTHTLHAGHTVRVTELVPDGSGGGTCTNPDSSSGDPRSTTTVTTDLFERIATVAERVSANTDATTLYSYDGNGNVSRIERLEVDPGAPADPEYPNIVTAMTHDWVGNRKQIVRDPDGAPRIWSYEYDRNGNLESQTSPGDTASHTTTYAYDALDRVTSLITPAGELAPTTEAPALAVGTTLFSYDAGANGVGRQTGITTPFGSAALTYDTWGNVEQQTRSFDLSSALGVTFTDSFTVTSENYTSTGKPMKVTEASGIRTYYSFLRHNWRPLWVKSYHGPGSYQHITQFTHGYNAAGLPKSIKHFMRDDGPPWSMHGGRTVYLWRDQLGRLVDEYSTDPTSTDDKIRQEYTYLPTGEVATLESRVGSATDARSFTFGYDDQHQLQTADDDKGYQAIFTYTRQGRLKTAFIAATKIREPWSTHAMSSTSTATRIAKTSRPSRA